VKAVLSLDPYLKHLANLSVSPEWFEEQKAKSEEYLQYVLNLIDEGRIGWSSGALPTSVKVAPSGHIDQWGIVEGSITMMPAGGLEYTQIQTVKSLHAMLRGQMPVASENLSNESNTRKSIMEAIQELLKKWAEELTALIQAQMPVDETATLAMPEEEVEELVLEEAKTLIAGKTIDEILVILEENLDGIAERAMTNFYSRRQARQAQVQKAMDKVHLANLKAHQQAGNGVSKTAGNGYRGANVQVGNDLRYAHLTASDMALGIILRTTPSKNMGINAPLNQMMSREYLQNMVGKMNEHANRNPYKDVKANATIKSLSMRANELDTSITAGQGDEWVGEWWSTDLWEKERFERHYDRLVSKGMMVQTIPQGAETAHFPTEGSDPVAYKAGQATSLDGTGRPATTLNINPFGTGRVSITPEEIKIATGFTTILEEDSIIAIASQVNRQLNEAALETRDRLLVNGDNSTGTTNINYDGTTVPSGLASPYYLASDGIRLAGLANGRDASNVLNLAQYRLTLALLDAELRQYRERMMFMIDPTTEIASLAIAEIQTDDVRRTNATITSGVLTNVYGIDVVSNGFIPQTDSDGKVTANVAGSRGTIALIYAPYWAFAYKRQISLEVARDIYSGTNIYVMSMRIGLAPRGTNAVAMTYNVATTAS